MPASTKFAPSDRVFPLLILSGRHGIYQGGGYVASLRGDASDNVATVRRLRNETWIDRYTRAVFVQFGSYNAHVNLFSYVTLLMEILPTGECDRFCYCPRVWKSIDIVQTIFGSWRRPTQDHQFSDTRKSHRSEFRYCFGYLETTMVASHTRSPKLKRKMDPDWLLSFQYRVYNIHDTTTKRIRIISRILIMSRIRTNKPDTDDWSGSGWGFKRFRRIYSQMVASGQSINFWWRWAWGGVSSLYGPGLCNKQARMIQSGGLLAPYAQKS